MLIELNRGGELWWVTRKTGGRSEYLRYGIKQPGMSLLCTFGSVLQLEDGDCVPCTYAGVPLLHKAKYGSGYDAVAYMETREQAMDIVLHMLRDHTGYLRRPVDGRSWGDCMMPFLTADYVWERVQC